MEREWEATVVEEKKLGSGVIRPQILDAGVYGNAVVFRIAWGSEV